MTLRPTLPGRHPSDREILRLAVPALGSLAAEPLYILTDTAVVGHLGTPELGGLAVAGTVLTDRLLPVQLPVLRHDGGRGPGGRGRPVGGRAPATPSRACGWRCSSAVALALGGLLGAPAAGRPDGPVGLGAAPRPAVPADRLAGHGPGDAGPGRRRLPPGPAGHGHAPADRPPGQPGQPGAGARGHLRPRDGAGRLGLGHRRSPRSGRRRCSAATSPATPGRRR